MSSKTPLLVLNRSNSHVIYALTRLAIQALRANIDRKGSPYSPAEVEALTTYITEGERLCTLIKTFHPDVELPFHVGDLLNEKPSEG